MPEDTDISSVLLAIELRRDDDGTYFIIEIIEDGTIKRYVANHLDPIGTNGIYNGRLQILGECA